MGELKTRIVDAERVTEAKRKAIFLMKKTSEEEQRKGEYLKSMLESMELWEEESVQYPVSISEVWKYRSRKAMFRSFPLVVDPEDRAYWIKLANKEVQPLYYCGGTLFFQDQDGSTKQLDTDFMRTLYSIDIKEVSIDIDRMTLIVPCEERNSFD